MKSYKIRNKVLDFPIIQGGMGVGVSLSNLAGHVAKEGCIGVLSTAQVGYRKPDFYKNPIRCNDEALAEEIKKAKEFAGGKGLVGVNVMVATNRYEETLKVALEAGVEVVISGAGLPLKLPELTDGYDVAIAPIISSGKAARIVLQSWKRNYNRFPDFVVLEGKGAGGHLGFKKEQVDEDGFTLEILLKEVLEAIRPFSEAKGEEIPVFVAGSVFDGYELAHYMKMGAFGAQIGTRFIATYECDASPKFAEVIINAKKEDIMLVKSPVGLPGRAIRTPFSKKLMETDRIAPTRCLNCLKPCDPKVTPYCISEALIHAAKGDVERGLFFSGENAWRIDRMYHVDELIDEIKKQWEEVQ